ncbi:MAG: hypothetical protein ABIK15_13995 [Pseudomonadota bacterium]
MNKILVLICCIGLLSVYSCGGDSATPEDFGKNHVKKVFSGISCNLDNLNFTVTEEGDDKATVVIEGDVKYKESLALVKKDNQWMPAADAAKLSAKEKAAAKKADPEKKAAH